jgi:copper chaperone
MKHRFEVVNIKCGGCARSIERALRADPRITAVEVDVAAGSAEGFEALKAKAKSFVCCAVGRLGTE